MDNKQEVGSFDRRDAMKLTLLFVVDRYYRDCVSWGVQRSWFGSIPKRSVDRYLQRNRYSTYIRSLRLLDPVSILKGTRYVELIQHLFVTRPLRVVFFFNGNMLLRCSPSFPTVQMKTKSSQCLTLDQLDQLPESLTISLVVSADLVMSTYQ
jgi:hypothetical protein